MASTWTCASGHTHDVTKRQVHIEPADLSPGQECKGSGDRLVGQEYAPALSGVVVKVKWTASTRGKSDL